MNWIEQNYLQIAAVLSVAVILTVGRAKLLPAVRSSKLLLWVAFVVTALCGLVLGWALFGVMTWLTGLGGLFGGIVGSVGAILAVIAGWWSVDMLVALIRDVADGVPDDEARKAALWFPTMAPAGISAVWGIVQNPRGLGTTITALIIGGVTVAYAHKVKGSALSARKGSKAWRWFAAAVCLLAGLVMIPLLAFLDAQAGGWLPDWAANMARILFGALGVGLLIGALVDIKDKVPDAAVRGFLSWGLPSLVLFGAVAVAVLSDGASSGGELIIGGVS
jgi:hypothetical protein